MKSKGKIWLALAVILVGCAAAWMFRRTDGQSNPLAETPGDELVLREKDGNVSGAPAASGAASYLLGKIDSLLPATSSARSAADEGSTRPDDTDTQPTARPDVTKPRLSEKPPWGKVNPVPALRSSPNANRTPEPHESTGTVRPSSEPKRRTHKIVDGDTLSVLAARYLGSAERYLEIFEANKVVLPGPDILPIGVELEIPPKNQYRPVPDVQDVPPATTSIGAGRSRSPRQHNINAVAPKDAAEVGPAAPAATISDPPIKRLVPVPPATTNVDDPSS